MAAAYAFRYLWGLPSAAPCKHCGSSSKVFRHFRNRPHDAFYICNVGNDKTACGGQSATNAAAPFPAAESERLEDTISKRGDANLSQDEINALIAKANKK
jgi:hypothetical protein